LSKNPSSSPSASAAPSSGEVKSRVASLGPSITIKGTLTGEEDLLIEGCLEGEVALHKQHVTIGRSGRVRADVYGSSICVEGEVNGNLFGEEQVVIRQSGKVRGNVTAPRVNLENGAKFKGAIDMQPGTSGAAGSEASAGSVASKGSAKPSADSRDADEKRKERSRTQRRGTAPSATRA